MGEKYIFRQPSKHYIFIKIIVLVTIFVVALFSLKTYASEVVIVSLGNDTAKTDFSVSNSLTFDVPENVNQFRSLPNPAQSNEVLGEESGVETQIAIDLETLAELVDQELSSFKPSLVDNGKPASPLMTEVILGESDPQVLQPPEGLVFDVVEFSNPQRTLVQEEIASSPLSENVPEPVVESLVGAPDGPSVLAEASLEPVITAPVEVEAPEGVQMIVSVAPTSVVKSSDQSRIASVNVVETPVQVSPVPDQQADAEEKPPVTRPAVIAQVELQEVPEVSLSPQSPVVIQIDPVEAEPSVLLAIIEPESEAVVISNEESLAVSDSEVKAPEPEVVASVETVVQVVPEAVEIVSKAPTVQEVVEQPEVSVFPVKVEPQVVAAEPVLQKAVESKAIEPMLITSLPADLPDFGQEAKDLPLYDASMPVIDSGIARLQLDEWFERLAKAPLNHPSVIAARYSEAESISTISEAKAILYPQVSVGLSAESQRNVRDGEEVSSIQGLDPSDKLRLSPNVTVKQLLFDAGATDARVAAATARSEAAVNRRESTEMGVAMRAADTLIELAKLQEQLETARENLDEVARLRDMIRERVAMGRDSPSEMLQMNTRVFEARNKVVDLQGQRALAGARHEETFGEPPVVLAFPDVFAPIPLNIDSSVDVALRQNPDLISARSLIDVAVAENEAAKSDGLPRLEVEARLNAYDAMENGTKFYDTFFGVKLSHNLFDGGKQAATVDRTSNGVDRARSQYDQTVNEVELALKRAYSNRESLIPRYKGLQAQLDQKIKTREAYEEQFIAGRRPLNDLVSAQQQVLDAAQTVIETKADLHRQHFTILALTGELARKR